MIIETLSNFKSDRRCWLFVLIACLAVVVSFRSIPDSSALTIVSKWGFWFVLVTFAIWLWSLWQLLVPGLKERPWRSWDWTSAGVVVAGGVILLSHEGFGFKIVMDELMLLGTSMSMHLDKAALTPVRGHDINGAFLLFDGIVDKRPLFFPFLLSLLHDAFGYRPANAFVLNAALTFVFLRLVLITGRALAGRIAGWLGVALFAGLPLLGQNGSGGGFELLNLTMILATLLLGALWVERRDSISLVAFSFSALLLAQVRYESAIFLLPVAGLILLGWIREGRAILPWPVLAAPLLVIHLPLHHRVFQLREASWEMFSKPGTSDPFSLVYVTENLQHALAFFFGSASEQPNSLAISAAGAMAVPFFALLLFRRIRTLENLPAVSVSVMVFCVGLAIHFLVLMCYFWGKFDEPVIRRLSLPTHLGLVLAVLAVLPEFKSPVVGRVALMGALIGLIGRGIPSMAAHAYTQQYLPGREVAWRRDFMKARSRSDYYMIDQDSILWITHGVSATPTPVAISRRKDLAFHLRNRTFSDIFVYQLFDIDAETGEMKVHSEDDLGPDFVIEPVTEQRLSVLTLSRISRVKEIKEGGSSISATMAVAPRTTKSRKELDQARQKYHENYMKQLP